MFRRNIQFLLITVLFMAISCDAPRENPFDPKADNYFEQKSNLVTSKIYVRQLYPPFKPIANAEIIGQNLRIFSTTNSKGESIIEHEPVDSLQFIVWANGFFPDTITFQKNFSNEYTIYLNAMPQLKKVQFTSFFNNVYATKNTTTLYFEAQITDLDGPIDIDKIILKNDGYQFDTTLAMDVNNNERYYVEFETKKISPELTTEQIPELNFYLIVKNLNNDSIETGPYYIRRVIEQTLIQLSPQESEVVRDSVTFRWINPDLPYDYVFNIVLLEFPTFESIEYKGIPKDRTSFTVKNLNPGRYSWKLQIEDNLKNICQSIYVNFYYE